MPSQSAFSERRPYEPRSAESALLYGIVSAELDGFLDDASERGHPIPRFVEKTFRDFLACGLPEHGFVRVHCDDCGNDRRSDEKGVASELTLRLRRTELRRRPP